MIVYDTVHAAGKNRQISTYLNNWNICEFWTMTTQNFSNLQAFQHFSPKCKIQFLPKLPKRIHSVPKRMYSEPAPLKFARLEKRASVKISKTNPLTFSGKNNLERKTKNTVDKKGLLLIKAISAYPSLVIYIDTEQFVLVPNSVYISNIKNQQLSQTRNYPLIRAKKNQRSRLNLWRKITIKTFLLKLILSLTKFYFHLA